MYIMLVFVRAITVALTVLIQCTHQFKLCYTCAWNIQYIVYIVYCISLSRVSWEWDSSDRSSGPLPTWLSPGNSIWHWGQLLTTSWEEVVERETRTTKETHQTKIWGQYSRHFNTFHSLLIVC